MKTYFAIVHKDPGSAYGMSFPDLPGCFSAADTADEIYPNAQQAVALYFADKTALPGPRSIETLRRDPAIASEIASGAFLIAIPLIASERKERYNIMLERSLAETMDLVATASGVSRSDYIAEAVYMRLRSSTGAVLVDKGGSTGSKLASAAAKVLHSKSATRAEKSVAASALTQKGSKEQTSAKVASSAGKLLNSKTASKSAKSAAASALAQKTKKKA